MLQFLSTIPSIRAFLSTWSKLRVFPFVVQSFIEAPPLARENVTVSEATAAICDFFGITIYGIPTYVLRKATGIYGTYGIPTKFLPNSTETEIMEGSTE